MLASQILSLLLILKSVGRVIGAMYWIDFGGVDDVIDRSAADDFGADA